MEINVDKFRVSPGVTVDLAEWPTVVSPYYKSKKPSPWFIVPADDKNNARVIFSRIVLEALGSLKMAYPKAGPARQAELNSIRERLT